MKSEFKETFCSYCGNESQEIHLLPINNNPEYYSSCCQECANALSNITYYTGESIENLEYIT